MSSPDMTAALELIRRGCELISAQESGSEEAKRLKPAVVLLREAADITKTVAGAGESVELRWRIYEMIQSQAGSDNAALYKELSCSIHLGLAGELSEPITLPCGHTFCKTCVAPLYTGSINQRKCPSCRVNIAVAYETLKPNMAIKGVIAHLLPRGSTYDMSAITAADAAVRTAATVDMGAVEPVRMSGDMFYGGSNWRW